MCKERYQKSEARSHVMFFLLPPLLVVVWMKGGLQAFFAAAAVHFNSLPEHVLRFECFFLKAVLSDVRLIDGD